MSGPGTPETETGGHCWPDLGHFLQVGSEHWAPAGGSGSGLSHTGRLDCGFHRVSPTTSQLLWPCVCININKKYSCRKRSIKEQS